MIIDEKDLDCDHCGVGRPCGQPYYYKPGYHCKRFRLQKEITVEPTKTEPLPEDFKIWRGENYARTSDLAGN